MMDFYDCDCACMACDVLRERRAHPPETEVSRLTRENADLKAKLNRMRKFTDTIAERDDLKARLDALIWFVEGNKGQGLVPKAWDAAIAAAKGSKP